MLILACTALITQAAANCAGWPAWDFFRTHLIVDGGRVLDPSDARRITTSEGQSYAMFFALVANDRATFDKLSDWTDAALAQGNLGSHLPAWLWGLDAQGKGSVLDSNSASDADLWLAYDLAEAGRLWHVPRYSAKARLLARLILREESADLPGLGRTLLPAPVGFHPADNTWRLNPSYLPLPVLRRFATLDGASSWPEVLASALHVIEGSAPHGFSPDWVLYQAGQGFTTDTTTRGLGSYDAIRSYLWAGMANPRDEATGSLQRKLSSMIEATNTRGAPPERVDTQTGQAEANDGPPGFTAAMLPLLIALHDHVGEARQIERLARQPAAPDAYFGQALSLFGQGWADDRYRFAPDGALMPAWSNCVRSHSR
ncbi:MAG: cellulase [Burkholderiales bacterium]|nr:cellulase [Burkholderiales bacterium]